MTGDALDRLAAACGVEPRYRDAWGRWRDVPRETRAAILSSMGHDVSSPAAAAASLRLCEEAAWRDTAPPVAIATAGRGAAQVPLAVPADAGGTIRWSVKLEDGGTVEGEASVAAMPETDSRDIDGRRLLRRTLAIGTDWPLGYHRLSVALPFDAPAVELALIVAPDCCFIPDAFTGDRRVWGLSVQLYAVRSARSWGMGDFSDLRRLVDTVGEAGGDVVGINPVHALFPGRPERCSPYAPSSRHALNILYIDFEAVPEFADCAPARAQAEEPSFRAALDSLRGDRLVDYPGVAAHKLPVLRLLYAAFRARHLDAAGGSSGRGRDFLSFAAATDDTAGRLAVFEALAEHFGRDGVPDYGWRNWPAEFRDAQSPAVGAFAAAHREAVDFHLYLQWEARRQLHACAARAKALGMAVGIYGDLALGADPDGADAWALGRLLADGASAGAPPDELNLKGQDWGFAPFVPSALRAAAYAPFTALLRHNMRDAGALRIDHAIGLQHLYWVPHGTPADRGGYVRQRVDDLLAVIALESVRNRCMVIGEDLGTLPEGLHDRLRANAMLSYRVLPFERENDGRFRRPSDYPRLALVAAGTHDLPPFAAYWRGDDLRLRERLSLFPTEASRIGAVGARGGDRRRMLQALAEAGLAPDGSLDPETDGCDPPPALIEAIHRFLARTPALLLLAQIEDLIGETEPANVPGTAFEYPNWRRSIALPIEALARDPRVRSALALLAAERPRR
jgi:4-alpha-glucanotransferase